MPANLNALIRYKTINSCLSGGRRRWTIDELRERCSETLAESRGRYATVSERTIRDDIRVMRSDILGFNAPIKQEGGFYFYSDPEYSILSLRITDLGLGEQILELLTKLRGKVYHPEMEIIIAKLCRLTGRDYEPAGKIIISESMKEAAVFDGELPSADMEVFYSIEKAPIRNLSKKMASHASRRRPSELIWGEIIAVIAGK
jgi:hypothetical protein